ncbi:MAG: malonyl-ACP O-methyltransferase BioC [Firmicutes bacterium]|nr:malonyl-ACP O-methyltransferase BioC [Bacillota bacterium]
MIDKEIMRRHFSRSARTYDEYARVQKEMAAELIKMVEGLYPAEILDIGCGAGLLTRMLCQKFPKARITAVDIAPGMIEMSRKKLSGANVSFRCDDIEEVEVGGKYDLIISNAAFQWFNFLGRTINKLYQALSDHGLLCFSTFGDMTFNELRQSYAKAREKTGIKAASEPGQSFYGFPELLSLCRDSISAGDHCLIQGKERLVYDYFPSVQEFLLSVKKIGANNSNRENRTASPALLKNMMVIYQNEFSENNQIKVTYHCLFVSVKRRA